VSGSWSLLLSVGLLLPAGYDCTLTTQAVSAQACTTATTHCTTSFPDGDALVALKGQMSVGGLLSSWQPNQDPCRGLWEAVICDASRARVVGLNFTDYHLTGPLPTAVLALPYLTGLWLGGNSFTGTLPAAYSQLTSLRNVDLSRNLLGGSLPPSWGNLYRLVMLDLSYNTFVASTHFTAVLVHLPALLCCKRSSRMAASHRTRRESADKQGM
jgi:hypothetical protein